MKSSTVPNGPIVSTLLTEDPSFVDIVTEFVAGLRPRLQQMEAALSRRQLADLRRLAHQLKGSGGGYGFDILTDLGRRLEEASLHNDPAECRKTLDELQSTVLRITVPIVQPA